MLVYRLLTEDDSSAFCHKVTEALSKGWQLEGSPTISFDAKRGVMRCAQAVVKDYDGEYSADMKLGKV
ncbi:MAG: DUF1737 domain-containing protein [Paracoccaceae bacterium]|jgi:hypothetical protein